MVARIMEVRVHRYPTDGPVDPAQYKGATRTIITITEDSFGGSFAISVVYFDIVGAIAVGRRMLCVC